MTPRFVIHIDHLVLDGIAPREAVRIVEGLRDEFARLVEARLLSAGAGSAGAELLRCRVGQADGWPRTTGHAIGRSLAGALHQRLAGHPIDRGGKTS